MTLLVLIFLVFLIKFINVKFNLDFCSTEVSLLFFPLLSILLWTSLNVFFSNRITVDEFINILNGKSIGVFLVTFILVNASMRKYKK